MAPVDRAGAQTVAQLATQTAVPRPAFRWIISRGVDLSLVSGSVLAGYAYLLLYTVVHVKISYLWWFWSVGFDGTHIFATASRTFFDNEARARNRKLFFGSLLFFFALGPALVLAGLKGYLYLLVGVWAYYHVIRQHYGFMVLYKVKNRDLRPLDNKLDRIFIGVMLVFPPFHRFFIHHPEELGIKLAFPRFVLESLEPVMWALVAATVAVYLARQVVRYRAGDSLDVPKQLLFAAIIPLHWLTFAYMSWQAAVPTVTIVHNLQYHALVWFHNRNRYTGNRYAADGGTARHGRIPGAVSRSLLAYAAAGLVFSLAYRIPGFQLGQVSDLAFGFFCGFGLTHYYLDSRIWRVRHDPGLREALQLA
ncbi:MAG TPA: hypothetical protein VNY05_26640 [Candidatus Acidoferrales bacterium]|jgi:hypothetical protein|nr:hypothetical protein [Candidatus Acidoferrales bacterium]